MEAYRAYDRDSDSWQSYSWREMADQIARWRKALAEEGLKAGDRVALQLRNCPEWVVFDQACLSLGLVVVPLYTDDRPENLAYILEDAAVKLLLVQDAGRWKRMAPEMGGHLPLQRVLVLDAGREAETLHTEDRRVRVVEDWLPESWGQLRARNGDPNSLATIVYTSGTTGRPKGVMLSHFNILSVAHAAVVVLDCYQEDLFLSFLPLSHTLERTAGYYLPVMTGSTVAYARSIAQLAEDLQTVRPTILIAVPRVFERVYGRISEQMRKKSVVARWLFQRAAAVGWTRFQRQQGRRRWGPALMLWPLLDKLVASKVTARLGGRLRLAVSGGAPLAEGIARVFLGLGVPLLQGYGLTETSPVISVNLLDDNEPASVGVPLRGIQVRIGEDEELLVKSPGVMLGYWNNHAATTKMIDSEGWLHTGDQARITDNHIFITGRLKDILVLSNGEKVPPSDMELAIALDPLMEQVLVIGEGRPFLSALVVLNGDLWTGFAQDCGLDPFDPSAISDSKVMSEVMSRIKEAVKDFPGYAKIRRVILFMEPWTVENGMLTPTLKVKRAKVTEKYATEIAALYNEGPSRSGSGRR
jgi:long-chain acyl-CoA synthetase